MSGVTLAGLGLALIGAPAALMAFRRAGVDSLSPVPRLALWVVAGAVMAAAVTTAPAWRSLMGLAHLDGRSALEGAGIAVVTLLIWPLVQLAVQWAGGNDVRQRQQFDALVKHPAHYRLFIVVTAAVVEELLYRGYAVGVGAQVMHGEFAAAAVSLAVFTASHYRWGAAHLLNVAWAGGMLTAGFLWFHDLYACIIAHFLIDAVGLLVIPAFIPRRAATDE